MTVDFHIPTEISRATQALVDIARSKSETTGHPLTEEELSAGVRVAIERCATAYEVAVGDVQADLSHARAELDATLSQRDDLEQRLATAEAETEACQRDAAEANANGRRQIAALQADVQNLRAQLEEALSSQGEPTAQVDHLRKQLELYKAHAAFLTARLRSAMSQLGAFEDKAKQLQAEWKGRIEGLPAMTLDEIQAAYDHSIRKLAAIGTTTEYFTIARMSSILLSPWEDIQDIIANDDPKVALSGGIEAK